MTPDADDRRAILRFLNSSEIVRGPFKSAFLGGRWRDHERWAVRSETWCSHR